ncbi:MAG: DUF2190 family protein [bacterium]
MAGTTSGGTAALRYKHGNVLAVDYTPSGADVDAGDGVVVGNRVYIAHNLIEDGKLGALAAGGGVYIATAGGAISAGDKLYWNVASSKVNADGPATTGDKCIGWAYPGWTAAADGDEIWVIHDPDGSLAS